MSSHAQAPIAKVEAAEPQAKADLAPYVKRLWEANSELHRCLREANELEAQASRPEADLYQLIDKAVRLNRRCDRCLPWFLRTSFVETMQAFAEMIGPNSRIIAEFKAAAEEIRWTVDPEDVLAALARRPCTLEDVANGLQLHPNEVLKQLERLCAEGRAIKVQQGSKTYYEVTRED